jgi:hypothetical protein
MASNSKNIAELLNTDTSIEVGDIADDAVTAAKIATGAVVADGLGAGSVTATKLGASAVTNAKLGAGAVTTAKIADSVNLGRRNMIINGAMQINQWGAYTISTTGSPEYGGPDRFHVWSYTSGEEVIAEISKSTVGGTPTGFANTYRFDVLTAESSVHADEALVVAQYIEAQNCQHLEYGTSDAKSVTLSFWIKTSVTGTYCFFLQNSDGDRIQVKEYTVSSANTWEKKIITIPGDTAGTINNDNGRGLWCGWVLMAGTNRQGSKDAWRTTSEDYATSNQVNAVNDAANNIYFTGIQLEVGDTATPFEHLSYAEELLSCERYYRAGFYYRTGILPWAGSAGGNSQQTWPLDPTMRASPTVTAASTPTYSSTTGTDGPNAQTGTSSSNAVTRGATTKSIQISNNATGATIYAVTAQLVLNAEL